MPRVSGLAESNLRLFWFIATGVRAEARPTFRFSFPTEQYRRREFMIAFSLRVLEPTSIRLRRLFVAAAGIGALTVVIYRAPTWLETWNVATVAATLAAATALLFLAVGVALQGSARAVTRVATELVFLAGSLLAIETILLADSPETWSDDPIVQRIVARERAAHAQGLEFDRRARADVVRELQADGRDAVPGFAQNSQAHRTVAAAIRERGLLPLSNVSSAYVVECNEGAGYLQFRSDELGFNNPPGLVSAGNLDIAIIGESFALGHCVPSSKSAADLIRARHPHTANFGIPGSRVLAHLGVLREYVQPLEPAVVIWFVNTNFAEPRQETEQPVLMKYLNDPSFSQRLRQRQPEVDAFMREIVVPLSLQSDAALSAQLERAERVPLERVVKFRELRSLVDFGAVAQRPAPPTDVSYFERTIDLAADSTRAWGGEFIAVILPSYEISTGRARDVARYEAVRKSLHRSNVHVIDGVTLFEAQPDLLGLYTLRINNHPSERGHALLAEAILSLIEQKEAL
jgi:hypothetical protein